MPNPKKPQSSVYRPDLVRLPALTLGRRIVRRLWKGLVWIVVKIFIRVDLHGRERLPKHGPMLVVSNHLGDADAVVGLALSPSLFDVMGKIELYDIPVLGWLMDAYGIIWVHRGKPDRRAIRAALDALAEDRILAIAPEGRESKTGGLEEGTHGAAYLALKTNVPVLPVAFTGTENDRVCGNIKRLRRTLVTMTVGQPFYLQPQDDRRQALRDGTETIMKSIARLLSPEYRGVYRDVLED
ncbi:MAG: lysophospholipid acyltransferase family protein [Chloroflexota bacterium]|nr:lysophospholipid acyltransferase family protein [Chloroflexota bacterium]